ncbi:hypothetical protein QN372_13130 [Undibacterium sp. RTI2.1]|uniref:hypothetical protein n=1 Tax=unclassified Undibacterium TaxID=2630295 RepID=UPI002AB37973|nr:MULTISPECIES: hypothetical protein [unclassified Undibacterium]MDY7540112.1 hypothetical protein [Undibacterium sp. 5I1]MEB0031697.1 hypothetical protein [Undibacterium sp. RTI2.1]MEB0118051.1 hypothetical protein [Undibacterium sp. RTI2.2]MEB0233136.1 hypothetical protein [Undibacterium sp. 10I3]MEB0259214.1 hypothetical protein [Undibacterium sp. 5I1]
MKITHFVCASALLFSPLLAHSQTATFNLKDIIKKSISDSSSQAKTPDATKDNANNSGADTANTGGAVSKDGIPKVLETIGIKIGDTRQQVDQVLTGKGYKLGSTNTHPMGQSFPGILWSLVYTINSSASTGSRDLAMVDVRFGPQSGKVMAILRREKFDHPVVATEIKKALMEKYGTPSSQTSSDLNWMAYRPGYSRTGVGIDLNDCNGRFGTAINVSYPMSKFKDCRQSVGVALAESNNSGREYNTIEVGVTDFAMMTAEYAAARAMMDKKNAEILEEHKKAPTPKL